MAKFIDDVFESLIFLGTIFASLLVLIIPIGLALFLYGGVTVDETDVNLLDPGRNTRADYIFCAEWVANIERHDAFVEATLWKRCMARRGWVYKDEAALQ